ncbi:MAG: DUF3408 domain-containing protein, partial [Rikenellaceae bacterium]|nr:DUF3408 domain-containing protein [Rikenellaceae bacterium]
MSTNRQQVTDIDVNAFIRNIADAGINDDVPINIPTDKQKDIQAGIVVLPELSEEKPKEQAKRKRSQPADYETLFLVRNEIRTRQGLYIGRDNYETLQTLVRSIRSERLSVSGLVEDRNISRMKPVDARLKSVFISRSSSSLESQRRFVLFFS